MTMEGWLEGDEAQAFQAAIAKTPPPELTELAKAAGATPAEVQLGILMFLMITDLGEKDWHQAMKR
jgi:hypothetical protein